MGHAIGTCDFVFVVVARESGRSSIPEPARQNLEAAAYSSPAFAGYDGKCWVDLRQNSFGDKTKKQKCEAAMAVGALDPGVPYESRWAPYDRIHGPGQGQFPEGSIRPRGYMAPDARRSFALAM